MIKIAPSILSADFGNLEKEIRALEQAGADMIHIDVMDGHFVPNLTFGPPVIKALRGVTTLPFDVHLMISRPEDSLEAYAEVGADIITIHPEATIHIDRVLDQIRSSDAKAGISLLPSSHENIIDYYIDKIDLILVMTVNPGFGGQKFMASQLHKIQMLAEKIKNSSREIILAVDGGINEVTAKDCIKSGATMLVAGSYIFAGESFKEQITKLRN